jgi:hypothetical protein
MSGFRCLNTKTGCSKFPNKTTILIKTARKNTHFAAPKTGPYSGPFFGAAAAKSIGATSEIKKVVPKIGPKYDTKNGTKNMQKNCVFFHALGAQVVASCRFITHFATATESNQRST